MAKNETKASKVEAAALDALSVLFDGVDPAKADAIRAHFEALIADERAAMQELLDGAEKAGEVVKDAAVAAASDLTPHALLGVAEHMRDSMSAFIVAAEGHALGAAKAADMKMHSALHAVSVAFTEFRSALTNALPTD